MSTIEECIKSVFKSTINLNRTIIVVDNNSTDKTLEILSSFGKLISVIPLSKNLGFGTANNIGIKFKDASYYYLHNADAFLAENVLGLAIEIMEKEKDIGIFGLPLVYPDRSAQPFAFARMSPVKKLAQAMGLKRLISSLLGFGTMRRIVLKIRPESRLIKIFLSGQGLTKLAPTIDLAGAEVTDVDWVCGAAMIIRDNVIKQIGAFDEKIFMYYEDEDICLRARHEGVRISTANITPIIHVCGWNNQKGLNKISDIRIASAQYFVDKHFKGFFKNRFMMFLIKWRPEIW